MGQLHEYDWLDDVRFIQLREAAKRGERRLLRRKLLIYAGPIVILIAAVTCLVLAYRMGAADESGRIQSYHLPQ